MPIGSLKSTQSESSKALKLEGLKILVTRPEESSDSLCQLLLAHGAEPIELAVIGFNAPEDFSGVDGAIAKLAKNEYDWCVFTSANGVKFLIQRLTSLGHSPSLLGNAKLAAVGPATAKSLEIYGLSVEAIPEIFIADEIAAKLGDLTGSRILLARADIARKMLPQTLRVNGAIVDDVAVYRTLSADPSAAILSQVSEQLMTHKIDVVTFTSASAARFFIELMARSGVGKQQICAAKIACIGPVTARAADELGLRVDIIAREHTIPGLVESLIEEVGR